ncbi:MAG: preprotein translocase subunit SecY, partial [Phycisphaerales bacterium]
RLLEWQRYATIALCIVQGVGWLQYMATQNMVYPEWVNNPLWWIMGTAALTAGTVFLMWLGEQIDKYGIGNGVSMIIMAGILAQIPGAVFWVVENFEPGVDGKMGYPGLILLLLGFVVIVAGSVIMTVAQRRIPVQQAKHTKGRKVFGGQRSYLPLRVNHSGVMPVVFASSLMIFPSVILGMVSQQWGVAAPGSTGSRIFEWLSQNFLNGEFLYIVFEVTLIYFFAYFWITVQFNPEDMAKQLRDHGSFIPGLRPGPRTAEYLETVMERITFVGATMLAAISVIPMVVNKSMNIDFAVAQFLGGTGMLIVVSVVMDLVQRVEANLLMRNYQGFLGSDGRVQSNRSS